MIRRTTSLCFSHSDRVKVGILGSGISGCTVASTLLESPAGKFDITLYEAGYGVGGRVSTRRILDNDGNISYQFDHGCQSIDTPKTKEFRSEFDRWKERGWIQPWKGKFATIAYNSEKENGDGKKKQPQPHCEIEEGERYVSCPQMNSICENLLQIKPERSDSDSDSTLEVVTKTHANAIHLPSFPQAVEVTDSAKKWRLETTGHGAEQQGGANNNNNILGDFDWIIVTDRNSAQAHRTDLRDANVNDFASTANKRITSLKSIATMVAFEEPLPLDVVGMDFDYYSDRKLMKRTFGSLGWIARDSSKPGRQVVGENGNGDSPDCWVLHASQREATTLLARKELKDADLGVIRKAIRETMVEDFMKSLPLLMSLTNSNEDNDYDDGQQKFEIPKIVDATGHRWGAAFPQYLEKDGKKCTYKRMNCHVDLEKQFIACGDYFGEHNGSVEGAFLSGRAAANHLIDQVTSVDQ